MEPDDATLLLSQRNQVFRTIDFIEGDASAFKMTTRLFKEWNGYSEKTHRVSHLLHIASSFYFTFGRHVLDYAPGEDLRSENIEHHDDWNTKLSALMDGYNVSAEKRRSQICGQP